MNFLSEGCNLSDVLGDQLRMDKVSRESWGHVRDKRVSVLGLLPQKRPGVPREPVLASL